MVSDFVFEERRKMDERYMHCSQDCLLQLQQIFHFLKTHKKKHNPRFGLHVRVAREIEGRRWTVCAHMSLKHVS